MKACYGTTDNADDGRVNVVSFCSPFPVQLMIDVNCKLQPFQFCHDMRPAPNHPVSEARHQANKSRFSTFDSNKPSRQGFYYYTKQFCLVGISVQGMREQMCTYGTDTYIRVSHLD